MKSTDKNSNSSTKKVTSRQVVAIVGIVLLVLLYVVTLIVSIFDKSASGKWFMACLMSTVAIPLLIWIYTFLYGRLTGKHTIADFDANLGPNSTPEDSEK